MNLYVHMCTSYQVREITENDMRIGRKICLILYKAVMKKLIFVTNKKMHVARHSESEIEKH